MPQAEDFDSADFARLLHQNKYRLVAKKGEGTFSEVLKAQSIITGEYFAIKCMKSNFKNMDQVNSLREIQALRRLNPHANIIDLEEVLYDKGSGRLALVFELMDQNVYELIRGRKQSVKAATIKLLMYQLLKAVAHMHKHGIFHRDIKPENILILGENYLKVADFGSCRGIYTQAPYTEYISTRWYRAPECLLTNGYYDYKMDIWGIGCVMFEIISLFPLFPGTNELDQIEKIHLILGTPPQEILEKFKLHSSHIKNFNFPQKTGSGISRLIPHASADSVDLMEKLLAYNPEHRITARQALRHPYFKELREAEKRERAVRTASPKLGRSLHSREAAAGAQGANGEEQEKEETAPTKENKKKTITKQASGAPHLPQPEQKKFPSINPSATLLPSPSSFTSNNSNSNTSVTGGGSTSTSMPHINPSGGISGNTGSKNLAGSTDSLPSPNGSPTHANQSKKPKIVSKKRSIVAGQPVPIVGSPIPPEDARSEVTSLHSGDGGESIGDPNESEEVLAKERAIQLKKEKLKEMSLLKNAATQGGVSTKKSTIVQTLNKNPSQHKLHIGITTGSSNPYAQYSVQQQQQQLSALAANLSTSGNSKKSKPHAPHATNMLPHIGGGLTSNNNPTAAAKSYESAYATRAGGQQQQQQLQTLAHLKSSASMATLAASASPSDDYGDYYDDHPSDGGGDGGSGNNSSALELLGGPVSSGLLKKTKPKKKQKTSGLLQPTQPPPGAHLLTSVNPIQPHQTNPNAPIGDHLSLSGHTATMTLHSSNSTTQLRSSYNGKSSKTKNAKAISLALQSLQLGQQDGK